MPRNRSDMNISDPRGESVPSFLSPAVRLLNDRRDLVFVWLALRCAGVGALGITLFFVRVPWQYAAPLYWLLLVAALLDRFTLMLHCTSHRPLFNKRFRALNHVIPWLIGPFFGQTPNSYFAHHLGMHHREENLASDLSSTMRFRRDRIDHWLRYYLRFLLFGLFELELYFYRLKQWKLFKRVLVGEGTYWALFAVLAWLRPMPTLVVFLAPLLMIRTLMMMGNWSQHSFIRPGTPENPYHSSITCINTRYNRRCFNDGYHILHHVKPACHWTEHPVEFERALADYGRNDALVFDGIDYFGIWSCLMLRRWSHLATHVVALEGAPERTREQVIALLKERVQPVPEGLPVTARTIAAEA
jgi:fatty acid desaturase